MYSKLDQISILGIMSKNPDFLPKKDQEKEIESDIEIRPASNDPKGCPSIAPSCHLSVLQSFRELHGGDDDDDRRKDQKKEIEHGILTRPTSHDPEGCPNVPPPGSYLSELRGFRELQGEDDKEQQRECEGEASGKPTLGMSEVAEDDDGFRTPDSWEHRIPVITECPPAPKKTRPKISSAKRTRTTAGLDLSKEVESLFPPPGQDDSDRTIKKLRREDGSDL